MDAVQASSFITPSKTEVLLDKIADLGGSHRAELLRSNIVIYVIKICEILDCNVSDVMTVDKISEYNRLSAQSERAHDGRPLKKHRKKSKKNFIKTIDIYS